MNLETTDFIISQANIDDAEILARFAAKCFWETYHDSPHLRQKDIKEYIASAFSCEQIRKEISDENALFLMCEKKCELVGYAKLLFGSKLKEIKAKNPVEICRIYVKQDFLGAGIGKILMEKSLNEAKWRGFDAVWLSVWQHNKKAQAFYEKFGFYKVGTHIFDLADSPQKDFLMRKDI